MRRYAANLVAALHNAADQGLEVDIGREHGRLTLGVIVRCAYG